MLEVHAERIQGVLVVSVRGDLDLATVDEFRNALEAARDKGAPIAVDLGAVEYIDMTCVRVLEEFHRELSEAPGGGLTLIVPPDALIRRVLEVIDLPASLRVVGSVQEAV